MKQQVFKVCAHAQLQNRFNHFDTPCRWGVASFVIWSHCLHGKTLGYLQSRKLGVSNSLS